MFFSGITHPSGTVVLAPLWKRRPALVAGLVLLLVSGFVQLISASPDGDFEKYHNRIFTVVQMADGDTFDIDHSDGEHSDTRIRLWGVDTPEVAGSRDGAMHFGAEASAFAKKALLGAKVRVVLARKDTRDKYNRLLAYVELVDDDISFNERLIREGLAYADWRFDHPLKSQFKQAERKARRNRIGLWAEGSLDDMPQWRRRMKRELDDQAP